MAEGRRVLSVSEVNGYIKDLMSEDFLLSDISVKGELSNVKYHSSGHIYFTLKDEASVISAVMFASDAFSLDFRLEAGDKVVVSGRVSVYEKAGSYQLYARRIKAAGEGELYRKFEELKKQLFEMGMFDPMYKKPIPPYVMRLGVVTAPTGAAVRDIINVAKRRNPYIDITLYPARVQGEGAASSIVRGIEELNRAEVDCIIIGRGGGSIEDLWAFNEEKVARAVFDSAVPVISGTGHETDTTIADLVADLRAPTPSAAAELAVFDMEAFEDSLTGCADDLYRAIERKILYLREKSADRRASIIALSPVSKLKIRRERLDKYTNLLKNGMKDVLTGYRNAAGIRKERLLSLSPIAALKRGYTFTETEDGVPLKSISDVKEGDRLKIYTIDGKVFADVRETEKQ